MNTMPSYKVADMLARYNQAYQVIFDDPVSGRDQMVQLFKEMDRISPRELAADGNKLENIRVNALHGILEALSAAGEYQSALEWLDAYGWQGQVTATDSIGIMHKAYCHYNLGDGRAAGELIRSLIDDEAEPSFMYLPNRFFTLVQYRQFELAHGWLEARRGQPTRYPGWATPKGISLLYRLEAELLLEEGHAERAMVAFDKATRDNKANV
ncbi:MAG TPA: hypothetical protein VLQ68_07150, partial [Rhizobiaceae bacterium]|nr:hypothetical protein [Rhizobiaceae bacterium]